MIPFFSALVYRHSSPPFAVLCRRVNIQAPGILRATALQMLMRKGQRASGAPQLYQALLFRARNLVRMARHCGRRHSRRAVRCIEIVVKGIEVGRLRGGGGRELEQTRLLQQRIIRVGGRLQAC